jgi:hypothetical protein
MINLDNIVLESEYNVTIQLIEEHFKQLMLIDNCEVYQEGVGDEYLDYRGKDKDGKKENIFMSIIKFIGRLINNIIYKIRQSIKKKKQIQGGGALLNEYCKKHETDIAKTIHPNGDSNLEIKIKCDSDKHEVIISIERTLQRLMPELHHNRYLESTLKLSNVDKRIKTYISTDIGDGVLKHTADVVDELDRKVVELTKFIDSAPKINEIYKYLIDHGKNFEFIQDNIHHGDETNSMSNLNDYYQNNQKWIDKIENGLDTLKRTFTQKLMQMMLDVEKKDKDGKVLNDQTAAVKQVGDICKIYLDNINALNAIVSHLADIGTAIDVINKEIGSNIKGSNKAKVENVTPEQSENNTNITNGFKNAVQKRDLHAIRITLKNSAYSDPSKEYYNANVAYLKEKDPELYNQLYETHDGTKFNKDKSSWDKKYLNQILVDLSDNFSRQRVDHLFEVARYIKSI